MTDFEADGILTRISDQDPADSAKMDRALGAAEDAIRLLKRKRPHVKSTGAVAYAALKAALPHLSSSVMRVEGEAETIPILIGILMQADSGCIGCTAHLLKLFDQSFPGHRDELNKAYGAAFGEAEACSWLRRG